MRCWIFTRAGQMPEEHGCYTDDVAYCWAWTKRGAIAKFGRLYADVTPAEVDALLFSPFRKYPWVVTDY